MTADELIVVAVLQPGDGRRCGRCRPTVVDGRRQVVAAVVPAITGRRWRRRLDLGGRDGGGLTSGLQLMLIRRATLQRFRLAASTSQLRQNADVEEQRDETRNEERHRSRVEDVVGTAEQHAPVHQTPVRRRLHAVGDVVDRKVVPVDQRRQARSRCDHPDDGGVAEGVVPVGATLASVPEREERGGEAVEGDEAEIPDGRRAEEDVDDQPRVAGGASEDPVTQTLVE